MTLAPAPFRLMAFALSAAISTTLFAAIVGSMPPEFDGHPNDARNDPNAAGRTEVAIVPSRIEVVGVRGDFATATDFHVSRPRT